MNLQEIMNQQTFAVVGDTLNPEKFAYKIKHQLLAKNYTVFCVDKELTSLNEIDTNIDVIDLCVNAQKGLNYLQECQKPFKVVLIQPGAEGPELLQYLEDHQLPYLQGCALQGLKQYKS